MKHLAAYMLCVLGGEESPSPNSVIRVLNSIKAKHDIRRVNAICAALNGKDVITMARKGQLLDLMSLRTSGDAASPAPENEDEQDEYQEEEEEEEEQQGEDEAAEGEEEDDGSRSTRSGGDQFGDLFG
eukprot:TRINITY_DN4514_c1_g1_i1.p2 TRINITY_DN4514_c1_g1~~TRINITY_DN4514_c1_g1_i1.p2  ORF type:complete len:128 (-),score=54.52 TRINITY_DN4514_c1_g1_i1:593-976(-)